MPGNSVVDYIRRFPEKCHAEVSRQGEAQACDKTAVAVAIDEDEHWYPVCPHHSRARRMVALVDLIGALNAR